MALLVGTSPECVNNIKRTNTHKYIYLPKHMKHEWDLSPLRRLKIWYRLIDVIDIRTQDYFLCWQTNITKSNILAFFVITSTKVWHSLSRKTTRFLFSTTSVFCPIVVYTWCFTPRQSHVNLKYYHNKCCSFLCTIHPFKANFQNWYDLVLFFSLLPDV